MRALTLLGLAEDGAGLLCADPATGEHLTVPADPRFWRAAQIGPRPALPLGTRRPAPLETQMEPQLRPREIQSRIRSGATLEQVAEEANCEPSRIERFAFPVLMERSMIADRGRQARPVIDGAPVKTPVEKLVRQTLAARGQAASMQWDAYRTEDGAWIVLLTWTAGRSENTARWTYHHSASGGTLTALDDAAGELMDPEPRPLRTVPEVLAQEPPAPPVNPLATQHEPGAAAPRPESGSPQLPLDTDFGPAARQSHGKPGNRVAAALAHHAVTSPTSQAAEVARSEAREQSAARTGTDDAGRRSQRAPMPSWEDVLLGVRSPSK